MFRVDVLRSSLAYLEVDERCKQVGEIAQPSSVDVGEGHVEVSVLLDDSIHLPMSKEPAAFRHIAEVGCQQVVGARLVLLLQSQNTPGKFINN